MLQTQSTVKTTAQGGVNGGRSQGGSVVDDIHGTTDGDRPDLRGSLANDREPMESSDTAGTGGLGRAVATRVRGGTRAPKA